MPPVMMPFSRWKRLFALGSLMVVLVGIIYRRGVCGAFIWDDRTYFIDNDILPNLNPFEFSAFFRPSNYWGELLPLRDWLYAVQYTFFGQNPFGYHLVSLVIYGGSAWALYLLLSEWYKLSAVHAVTESSLSWLAPAFVTIFFVVHPVHVETVAYISGQKDLLAGLFGFFALLFFGRYFRQRRLYDAVLLVGCYYLAFLSKLSAVFLPFFILLLSFTLYRDYSRKALLEISQFALLNLLPVAWVLYTMKVATSYWGTTSQITGISFFARLTRALQILGVHTKQALFPYPLNFGYPFEFTPSLNSNLFFGLAVLFLIVVAVCWRQRLLMLGASLFFLGLFPVLQIFNELNNAAVYDRYLFVSVVGLGVVLAQLASFLVERFHRLRKVIAGLAFVVLSVLGVVSFQYVPAFAADVASTRHAYQTFPQDSSNAFNYVTSLIEAGEHAQAQVLIAQEISFRRPSWVIGYLRGWIALEQGRFAGAESLLRGSAIQAQAGGFFPYPNLLLAQAMVAQGRSGQAVFYIDQVLNAQIYNPLEFYRAKKMREKLAAQH